MKRFLNLENCTHKGLKIVVSKKKITGIKWLTLQNISDVLNHVQLVIKILCSENSTLVTEAIFIQFLLSKVKIRKNVIPTQLQDINIF